MAFPQDGRPSEARLVDLAGIRCASPALDILHFLNTSLPRDVRRRHRVELLRRYLDALGDTVRRAVTGVAASPAGSAGLEGKGCTALPQCTETRRARFRPEVTVLPKIKTSLQRHVILSMNNALSDFRVALRSNFL